MFDVCDASNLSAPMCNYITRFELQEILHIFQKDLLHHINLLATHGSIPPNNSSNNANMEISSNRDNVTYENKESAKVTISPINDSISTDDLKVELMKQQSEILSMLETKYTIMMKSQLQVDMNVEVIVDGSTVTGGVKDNEVGESISSNIPIPMNSSGIDLFNNNSHDHNNYCVRVGIWEMNGWKVYMSHSIININI